MILLLGQPLKWVLVVAPFKPDMIQIVVVGLTEYQSSLFGQNAPTIGGALAISL